MRSGYAEVWLDPADPLAEMAGKDGYVYEHRLVMARSLGRCLLTEEQVHHRNADKLDNRLENLMLASAQEHQLEHHREIARLRARVKELEHELARKAAAP